MTGRPTLRDVAERAQVSIKTASRVINSDPQVSEKTRQLVQAAIDAIGYQPDLAARSLRSGRDATVGIVIESFEDPFFAALAGAAESELFARGYTVLVAGSRRSPEREHEVVLRMVQRRVSGLIVVPARPDSLSWLSADVAVTFADRVGAYPKARSVIVDDRGNAADATRHLIRQGHTRIALVHDRPEVATSRERQEGFREAMAGAGIEIDDSLIKETEDPLGAQRATLELLALPEPPTAIFSTNTRCSLGMVAALHRAGRTDIAHLSYGDFAMAESLSPAVTVVDHDGGRMGRVAASVLLQALGNLAPGAWFGTDDVVYVPAGIVPRGSGEQLP